MPSVFFWEQTECVRWRWHTCEDFPKGEITKGNPVESQPGFDKIGRILGERTLLPAQLDASYSYYYSDRHSDVVVYIATDTSKLEMNMHSTAIYKLKGPHSYSFSAKFECS